MFLDHNSLIYFQLLFRFPNCRKFFLYNTYQKRLEISLKIISELHAQ